MYNLLKLIFVQVKLVMNGILLFFIVKCANIDAFNIIVILSALSKSVDIFFCNKGKLQTMLIFNNRNITNVDNDYADDTHFCDNW